MGFLNPPKPRPRKKTPRKRIELGFELGRAEKIMIWLFVVVVLVFSVIVLEASEPPTIVNPYAPYTTPQ